MKPPPDHPQDKEATWFQAWETVTTEGTPVTPPFATTAELVDYLATRGDFWDSVWYPATVLRLRERLEPARNPRDR